MPWKTLNLYIHAYQSKLWNRIVKELIKNKANNKAPRRLRALNNIKVNNIRVPLIGFATEVQDKDVKKIVDKILQNENVTKNDFVIRAIPELSSAGSERELYAEVKGLKVGKLEDDELNKGRKKVKISFLLGKGSYATEVVKAMF